MRVRMDPSLRPTMEKSFPSEDDVALAKRRRQRTVKKERKRRQRREAKALETQGGLAEGEIELVVERKLEKGLEEILDAGKGARSSSFDSTETNRIDWADEVDASIPCLQPIFDASLQPRDLSCLRTDARSPWSSLCRRHQRIQRRQHNNQPSFSSAQHPQHLRCFTSRRSRADASTWWRRAPFAPSRSLPSRQRSDFRWQPPSSQYRDHCFKPRRAQMPLFTQRRPQYKTDRSTQTEPPPSRTANCSVQTDTPTAPLAIVLQDGAVQTDSPRTSDLGMQTTKEQPSKSSCAVQTDNPRTSDSGAQTTEDFPPKISRAVETSIPPLRTRIAPIVLNTVAETASPRDETFQALLRFEASPRYKTVLQALEPFHDLLFSYVAHPHGRYEPLPVTLPTDPAMQFVEMYVKGWFKTWLKNKT
ncbi:hypothetical protein SCHPADRAFT_997009 [Schizopora paradoxa]|uniref:Uncharacterized protein n=1 Tax=Schizopora paradoxa TaxID=27342 RepID=A0A0H2RPN1_9AGAM|nr:hypothetical protein SCHPADRAFT_997009 [Schizopora paradoxa]